jgi:hypothetical protein
VVPGAQVHVATSLEEVGVAVVPMGPEVARLHY